MRERERERERESAWALSLCFCGILLVPMLLWITQKAPAPVNIIENRRLTPQPDYSTMPWRHWPTATDRWINDNIPLRTQAIEAYMNIWEWNLFTPTRNALRGSGGYMFSKFLVRIHSGASSIDKNLLYKMRALFVGRQFWFSQRNIQYVLAIPPNKEASLIDYLPNFVRNAREKNFLPRLRRLLDEDSVSYIAFEDTQKKTSLPLSYFYNKKYDNIHWNTHGLLNANEALRHWLQENIPPGLAHNSNISPQITAENIDAGPHGMDVVPKAHYTIPNSVKVDAGVSLPITRAKIRKWGPQAFLITSEAPSLRLAIASDSYFQWSGGPRLPKAHSQVLPLVLDTQATLWMDNEDFSYATMERIANEFKPHAVIEEHCERELSNFNIRRNHKEVILIGEKYLGNLKIALGPDSITSIRSHTAQVSSTSTSIRITAPKPYSQISLSHTISTNTDGYAVVAAMLRSPHKSRAVLHYRAPNSTWKRVEQQTEIGDNILIFQVISEKNTNLEMRFEPGQPLGEYHLLPTPFLNDITEGSK